MPWLILVLLAAGGYWLWETSKSNASPTPGGPTNVTQKQYVLEPGTPALYLGAGLTQLNIILPAGATWGPTPDPSAPVIVVSEGLGISSVPLTGTTSTNVFVMFNSAQHSGFITAYWTDSNRAPQASTVALYGPA